jgi:hypothetical protein
MLVQELESTVLSLRPKELKKFRTWFEKFDAEKWDEQFENDVDSGKLDSLAKTALRDFAKGKCTSI